MLADSHLTKIAATVDENPPLRDVLDELRAVIGGVDDASIARPFAWIPTVGSYRTSCVNRCAACTNGCAHSDVAGTKTFLLGIISGFNGCLSTQSTFVFELHYLAANPKRALSYAFRSIGGAQVRMRVYIYTCVCVYLYLCVL